MPNEWGSMCSDFYKQNWKALICYCMIIHSVHVHSQLLTPTMATSKSRTSGWPPITSCGIHCINVSNISLSRQHFTHTVIPTCPLVALKHHMKDSHCSFVSSEKVEFFSFQALKPAEYSIEYGVHQTKATLSVQLTRVVKIFKLELHFRSLLKKISV